MRVSNWKFSFFFVLCFLTLCFQSLQAAGESDTAEISGAALLVDDGTGKGTPLKISQYDLSLCVEGFAMQMQTRITFQNPSQRDLEGTFVFPLPPGASLDGYALDIEGTMVEGVAVPKERARIVFEEIERAGIDPGLLEWVGGNHFRTRIFPIPAGGTRIVHLRSVETLSGGSARIPLRTAAAVERFSLEIQVDEDQDFPEVLGDDFPEFPWKVLESPKGKTVRKAEFANFHPQKDLVLKFPVQSQPRTILGKAKDGKVYFAIEQPVEALREKFPARKMESPKNGTSEQITVFWDASFSRSETDHEKEWNFLREFLRVNPVDVELIVFRDAPENPRLFSKEDPELFETLAKTVYDGGTNLGILSREVRISNGKSKFAILFSDGISNFGANEIFPLPEDFPIYCVCSGGSFDSALLKQISLSSGGDCFFLDRLSAERIAAEIGMQRPRLIGVKGEGTQIEEIYPTLQSLDEPLIFSGILVENRAKIVLHFGYGSEILERIEFSLEKNKAVDSEIPQRIWARKKLAELLVFGKENRTAIREHGMKFGLVSPETSLLVLEDLAQYVRYGIEPPESFRAHYREKHGEDVPPGRFDYNDPDYVDRESSEQIEIAMKKWNAYLEWWKTEFQYPADFRYEEPKYASEVEDSAGLGNGVALESSAMDPSRGGGGGSPAFAEDLCFEADMDGVGVPGTAALPMQSRDADSGESPESSVRAKLRISEPESKNYIAEMEKVKDSGAEEIYAVYLQQRREFQGVPMFFLECASYFEKLGDRERALRILSNLAEMELENDEILRMLGFVLMQWNRADLAVGIFEQVLGLRPEFPQPYYDLAEALAQRAADKWDYDRALELLWTIVKNPWDTTNSEITIYAIQKANRIIPKAKRFGVERLHFQERFIEPIDLDLRVFLTWSYKDTDIDLWVAEPSGEQVGYSHKHSTIGGQYLADCTDGYGPEEYAIRKGMKGIYKVRINYYGSRSVSLFGPVMLRVDIYTDYGRENERHRTLFRELPEEGNDIEIGEVEL